MVDISSLSLQQSKAKLATRLKISAHGTRASKKTWKKWVEYKRFRAFMVNTVGEDEAAVPKIFRRCKKGKGPYAAKYSSKRKAWIVRIVDAWEEDDEYHDEQDLILLMINFS